MNNILKNRNLHNASWIILGNIAQMVITLIMGMITSRYLGPANYGLIAYVASFVSFFSSLTTLGLTSTLVRELVARPEKQGICLGTAIGLRLMASGISMAALQALMWIIQPGDRLVQTVTVLQSAMLLCQSFDAIKYWYQSRLESRVTTVICLAAYAITAVYKIVILIGQRPVEWFAATNVIDFGMVALMYLAAYRHSGGQRMCFSWTEGKKLLGKSYPYIVSGVLVSVFTQTDKIMLGMMEGNAVTGYYTAALHVCTYWSFIPQAIIDSFRPTIMELNGRDKGMYRQRLQQLLAAIIWISVICCGMICLFAGLIIRILNGSAYLAAAPTLRILIWYSIFAYIGPIKNIWLICEGKSRYEQIFAFSAAALNVALNYLLIRLMGMNGAAVATLIAQICANVLVAALIPATAQWGRMVLDAFLLKDVDIKFVITSAVQLLRRRR